MNGPLPAPLGSRLRGNDVTGIWRLAAGALTLFLATPLDSTLRGNDGGDSHAVPETRP